MKVMHLFSERNVDKQESLSLELPERLKASILHEGAMQVIRAWQKKTDNTLLKFAVVPLTYEVDLFVRSDGLKGFVLDIVHDKDENPYIVVAQDEMSKRMASQLFSVKHHS